VCGAPVQSTPAPEKSKGMSEEDLIMTLGMIAFCLYFVGLGLASLVISIIEVVKARKLKNAGHGTLDGNAQLGNVLSIVVLVLSVLSVVASVVAVVWAIVSYVFGMSLAAGIMGGLFDALDEETFYIITNVLQTVTAV
jgi:hypothetical protein